MRKAAFEHALDRLVVRGKIASRAQIKDTLTKSRRKKVKRVSNVHFPAMEAELLRWLKTVRLEGAYYDGKAIRHKALHIIRRKQAFIASNGWFFNYLKRDPCRCAE